MPKSSRIVKLPASEEPLGATYQPDKVRLWLDTVEVVATHDGIGTVRQITLRAGPFELQTSATAWQRIATAILQVQGVHVGESTPP